jgi:hypothetical protein
MIKLYHIYVSTNKDKKFDIYIKNPQTHRINKISFGAKGYEDYTMHHDKNRRDRYRLRHKHDHITDPTSSGFWSYWILWGSSTDSNLNIKLTLSKFKLVT